MEERDGSLIKRNGYLASAYGLNSVVEATDFV